MSCRSSHKSGYDQCKDCYNDFNLDRLYNPYTGELLTYPYKHNSQIIFTLCPICKGDRLPQQARYKNVICDECINEATVNGECILFSNTCIEGGISYKIGSGKWINGSIPFTVKGIDCYACEARFGGIVHMMST